MDLDRTSDQSTLLAGIEPLLAKYRHLAQPAGADYLVYGDAFNTELEQAGFYGDTDGFALSTSDAGILLEAVSQCPFATPAMASLIVLPGLGLTLPRPVALLTSPVAPARFLAESKTALIIDGGQVLAVDLADAGIEPLKSIFAYPYARIVNFDRSKVNILNVSPEGLRTLWRLGLAFEMLGALRAAHGLTVEYVKQRTQFKRLIGSFQAVQHRLAEGTTHIEALALLVARAAWSRAPADIALAASYAQKQAVQIVYDCHQFHGAMGLTLEYVLHHWTYRLKVLAGELGGSSAQARAATKTIWGDTP
jgi:hypothetical protein